MGIHAHAHHQCGTLASAYIVRPRPRKVEQSGIKPIEQQLQKSSLEGLETSLAEILLSNLIADRLITTVRCMVVVVCMSQQVMFTPTLHNYIHELIHNTLATFFSDKFIGLKLDPPTFHG